MTNLKVYGSERGFSLWINTPDGTHLIGAYGKLRVEIVNHFIRISKGPGLYHVRDFFIGITRHGNDLDIITQTTSVSQTRLVYKGLINDVKWQEIIDAAQKAGEESGQEEEHGQEEYESE